MRTKTYEELTQRFQDKVRTAQHRGHWRKDYMFLYEHEELARKSGREEGREEALRELIRKKMNKNKSIDQIADELEMEKREVSAFIEKMEKQSK